MVVADRVVLVGAVETFAAGDGGAQCGEVLDVPPGVLSEEDVGASEKDQRRDDPKPAETAASHRYGKKIDERDGENGHPAPGELHEAKLGQELPNDRGEAHQRDRGKRGEHQKYSTDCMLW